MLDCQTPLPALTHSLGILEVARAQTTSAIMSLPFLSVTQLAIVPTQLPQR